MRSWIAALLFSFAVGGTLGLLCPRQWGFGPADGIWIGSALYVAGLRRYVDRATASWDFEADHGDVPPRQAVAVLLPGVLGRTTIFLGLFSLQAYLCFHVLPGVDVRRGFVLLSAWVVMQALFDTREIAVSREKV